MVEDRAINIYELFIIMPYQLNLPPVPLDIQTELVNFANEYIKTWKPESNDGYKAVYGDQPINYAERKVVVGFSNPRLTQFVESVCPLIKNISLFLMVNKGTGPAVMPPHTDFDRELAINFVVQTGGDNVVTSFFKECNNPPPVIKNGHILSRFFHEDRLEKIGSIVFKQNNWVMFSSQNPHTVENIEGFRILISMTMDYTEDEVVKNFPELILC